MIVDDEVSLLGLVEQLLGQEGYNVERACRGEECLKKLLKQKKIDLIIMDRFMPNMDGKTVCKNIRSTKRFKDLKIIFLTVAEFNETGEKILSELDVSDYITKPFDNHDLIFCFNRNNKCIFLFFNFKLMPLFDIILFYPLARKRNP